MDTCVSYSRRQMVHECVGGGFFSHRRTESELEGDFVPVVDSLVVQIVVQWIIGRLTIISLTPPPPFEKGQANVTPW